MPPAAALELQVDAAAQVDILVAPTAYPAGTLRGDLLAIRPALVPGKGKAKDRPLLYKVEKLLEDEEAEAQGSSTPARRRNKAQVTVSGNVAQSFPWIKNRQEVVITLVSIGCSCRRRAC